MPALALQPAITKNISSPGQAAGRRVRSSQGPIRARAGKVPRGDS
jgi:hypothetical protein